jgi:hypothetical protein
VPLHLLATVLASVIGRVLGNVVVSMISSGQRQADLPTTAAKAWPDVQAQMPQGHTYDRRVGQLQTHSGLLEAMHRQPGILIPVDGGRTARLGDPERRFSLDHNDGAAIADAMAPSRLLTLASMHQITSSDFISMVGAGYEQLILSSPDGQPMGTVPRRRLLVTQFTSLVTRLSGTSLGFNEDEFRQRINQDLLKGVTITTADRRGNAPALHIMLDIDQLHRREAASQRQVSRLDSWAGNVLPETDAAAVLFLCAMRRPGQRLVARSASPTLVSDRLPLVRSHVLPELSFAFQVTDLRMVRE